MAGTLATYIDTFYFTENSLRVTEKKKAGRGPLGPPLNPKKRWKAVYFEGGGHYDGKYLAAKLENTVNMLHSINLKVQKLVGLQTSCSSLRSVTSFPTLFTTCKN